MGHGSSQALLPRATQQRDGFGVPLASPKFSRGLLQPQRWLRSRTQSVQEHLQTCGAHTPAPRTSPFPSSCKTAELVDCPACHFQLTSISRLLSRAWSVAPTSSKCLVFVFFPLCFNSRSRKRWQPYANINLPETIEKRRTLCRALCCFFVLLCVQLKPHSWGHSLLIALVKAVHLG